jgi:hypothetical protein
MTPDPKQVKQTQPTPKGEQVTITLPPGVTADAYIKSMQTWQEQKDRSAKVMKADWRAMTDTCKAHPQEYHDNRVKRWKEEGLDSTKIKVKK